MSAFQSIEKVPLGEIEDGDQTLQAIFYVSEVVSIQE